MGWFFYASLCAAGTLIDLDILVNMSSARMSNINKLDMQSHQMIA